MLKTLVRAALFALGMGFALPALAQQVGFYLPSTKPSDPAGTASASFVQAGVGNVCWFQQQTSGRFTIYFTGKGADSTAAATVTVQASYGTGTPPANGAAATGTVIGNPVTLTSGAGGQNYSWALINQIGAGSILPNTPYWVDLQFKASAATGSVNSITCSVDED